MCPTFSSRENYRFFFFSKEEKRLYIHPFVLFIFFLALNSFLAYGRFSFETKLWLLLGILLLFAVALNGVSKHPSTNALEREETLPHIPGWVWILVATVGLPLWLYQLNGFQWPIPDEGYMSYFSIELSRKWVWHPFFSTAQHPALFNWLLALYFKAIPPSLFSMRLFPTLIALLTVAIGYKPIRKFFPDSFGLVYFFLLSASFWPLFMASLCLPHVVGFFWEVFTLIFFVFFLKAAPHQRLGAALALGFAVGFGFFATIPWLFLAAPLTLAVFITCLRHFPQRQWKTFCCFFLPVLVFVILFSGFSLPENYGEHILSLFSFQNGYNLQRHVMDWGGYVSSLFWSAPDIDPCCPVWGGMFNSILDSLFLLGVIESWRLRKTPKVQWVFLALASCWVPAVISRGVEMYRVFLIIPFLFFIVGMGFQTLAKFLAPSMKGVSIGLILAASCFLDFHHLQKHLDPRLAIPDAEARCYFQAHQILKRTNEKNGPGAFLLNIGPNMENQNLLVSTYPFNAAFNFRLSFNDCRWIAVIVNEQYRLFLTPRFPSAVWFPVEEDHYWHQGNNVLAIIPIDNTNRSMLEDWFKAEQLLQPITLKILNARDYESQKPFMDDFYKTYAAIKTDPFLASTLIERMLFYKRVDSTPPAPLELIRRGLKDGYPLPVFCRAEKLLMAQGGKNEQKKKVF